MLFYDEIYKKMQSDVEPRVMSKNKDSKRSSTRPRKGNSTNSAFRVYGSGNGAGQTMNLSAVSGALVRPDVAENNVASLSTVDRSSIYPIPKVLPSRPVLALNRIPGSIPRPEPRHASGPLTAFGVTQPCCSENSVPKPRKQRRSLPATVTESDDLISSSISLEADAVIGKKSKSSKSGKTKDADRKTDRKYSENTPAQKRQNKVSALELLLKENDALRKELDQLNEVLESISVGPVSGSSSAQSLKTPRKTEDQSCQTNQAIAGLFSVDEECQTDSIQPLHQGLHHTSVPQPTGHSVMCQTTVTGTELVVNRGSLRKSCDKHQQTDSKHMVNKGVQAAKAFPMVDKATESMSFTGRTSGILSALNNREAISRAEREASMRRLQTKHGAELAKAYQDLLQFALDMEVKMNKQQAELTQSLLQNTTLKADNEALARMLRHLGFRYDQRQGSLNLRRAGRPSLRGVSTGARIGRRLSDMLRRQAENEEREFAEVPTQTKPLYQLDGIQHTVEDIFNVNVSSIALIIASKTVRDFIINNI